LAKAKTDIVEFFVGSQGPNKKTRMAKDKSFLGLELMKQAYPTIEDDFQKMFFENPKAPGKSRADRPRPKEPSYRISS